MKNIIFLFAQVLKGIVLVAVALITAIILLPVGILLQLFLLCGFIFADVYELGKRLYRGIPRRKSSGKN